MNATFPLSFANSTRELSVTFTQNKITCLQNNTFYSLAGVNLSKLTLTNNIISIVDSAAFEELVSVNALILTNNPLSNASLKMAGTALVGKSIELLDLSGVQNDVLNSLSYFGGRTLTRLRLSRNLIYSLHDYTFVGFRQLTNLDLSRNFIKAIAKKSLVGLDNLVGLNLAYNMFLEFPENLPTTLETLVLKRNQIKSVNNDKLKHLNFLDQ